MASAEPWQLVHLQAFKTTRPMMRVSALSTLALVLTFSVTFSQTKPAKSEKNPPSAKPAPANLQSVPVVASDPVLLMIGNENVPKSEFERVFKKNNRDSVYTETSVREYLDLYINYKLKVKEAEAQKLDTSETFKTELAGYRKQLAQPYLTDKEVSDQLIREAYERLNKDIRVSHILIKLNADALPKDTLSAYNRALKLRDAVLKGADFAKIARDSSEDPSAKENSGDLGYFTGMQMVYPFETVAFNTKPGQISMPVRTRFGYHVIKVHDVRTAQGEIHTAHMMVRLPKEPSDSIINAAREKIKTAQKELQNGAPWDSVVLKYSDDKGSAKKGGELPWFGTGRMVPEFEKAAFALKNDGDISDIVQSMYGFHIIKRLEKRGIPPFEEKKNELRQMIIRDSRNEASKNSMVAKIRKEYNFKEFPKNKDEFINSLDSSLAEGEWDLNKAEKFNKPVISFTDKKGTTTLTQQDFATYISTHQTKRPGSNAQAIGYSMYTDWAVEQTMNYEEARLDDKYPDFRNLMKEYRDGILLFDLTDRMVWTKAVKDSSGLQEFYEKNKNNYMWGERCDATLYACSDAATADELRKQLKKGKKSEDAIIESLNKAKPNSVVKQTGRYNHGDSEIIEQAGWKTGISDKNIGYGGKTYVVNIREILPPMPKSLDEARGVVTADYQNYLEVEWIRELRNKYPVTVNQEVLKTVWQK
jgi:peptidyl-prolyl cis-trans isomerase SurA